MRYVRQHLFVPAPSVWDLAAFNQRLAVSSLGLSDGRAHYSKGVLEGELSLDDSLALLGLPERPYDVVRYERRRADKQGKFTLGVHRYSSDPALAGRDLVVGLRALSVDVYDPDGTPVATHPRAYGDAPTDTSDPARQLPLPCPGPAARTDSPVGASMPAAPRGRADALAASGDVRPLLRTLRDEAAPGGYAVAPGATGRVAGATGAADPADVALAAVGVASGDASVAYDEPVDLSAHGAASGGRGRLRACSGLLADELSLRESTKRARLFRKARFPCARSPGGYDFSQVAFPDGHARADPGSLGSVARAQDFVFYGQSGRGKTHLAVALGRLAVERGAEVRLSTAPRPVLALRRAPAEGAAGGLPAGRGALLAADDRRVRARPVDVEGAGPPCRVVPGRCGRGSAVFTANTGFSRWGAALGDGRPPRPPSAAW